MGQNDKQIEELFESADEDTLRLLMELLGEDFERQKTQKKKVVNLKTYNLGYIYNCRLCGAQMEKWFQMSPDEELGCLRAIHLPKKPESGGMTSTQRVNHCEKCQDKLSGMSREELVGRILRYAKEVK